MSQIYAVQAQNFNREAARDAAKIGNVNVETPEGSVTYTGTPGQPDYFRRERLNPTLALATDRQHNARALASDQAYARMYDFIGRYGPIDRASTGLRGTPLTAAALPAMPVDLGYGSAADPASVRGVENAVFQRGAALLDPRQRAARERLAQSLADLGVDARSRAGMRAGRELAQQQAAENTRLGLDAVLAGRQEHSRLAGLGMQRRDQEARLQQQQWEQLERGRRAELDERLLSRQQAAAEISHLMGLGDFRYPTYAQPAQPNVAAPNYLGYLSGQGQQRSSLWGSLGGAAASVIGTILGSR